MPYLCPAGVPTIGYGFTRYASGRKVTMRDLPMARDLAEAYLTEVVRREVARVCQLIPNLAEPKRLAALVDFSYNLGTAALAGSTLRKRANEGDWRAVCKELSRWVHIHTSSGAVKTELGLVRRRAAEIKLIEETL